MGCSGTNKPAITIMETKRCRFTLSQEKESLRTKLTFAVFALSQEKESQHFFLAKIGKWEDYLNKIKKRLAAKLSTEAFGGLTAFSPPGASLPSANGCLHQVPT